MTCLPLSLLFDQKEVGNLFLPKSVLTGIQLDILELTVQLNATLGSMERKMPLRRHITRGAWTRLKQDSQSLQALVASNLRNTGRTSKIPPLSA